MAREREKRINEARKLFSQRLRVYRNREGLTQGELGERIDRSQSHIALLESKDVYHAPRDVKDVEGLVVGLNLSPEEAEEFRQAANGTWYDYGKVALMELDGIGREVEVFDARQVWVAGRSPLEFSEDDDNIVYQAIYERVKAKQTIYTYWLPSDSKKSFDMFLGRLKRDLHRDKLSKKKTDTSIECILSESQLPLVFHGFNFSIYDPLSEKKRAGRQGIYGNNDEIARIIPLHRKQTDVLYSMLSPIYERLFESDSEHHEDDASFVKYYPR